jgi:glycosyltransferase involved in cell wall biosynthesis
LPRVRVVIVSRWYPSPAEPLAGVFVEDQARTLREVAQVEVIVPRNAGLPAVARGLFSPVPGVIETPRTPLSFPLRVAAVDRAFGRLGPAPDTVVHVHLLLPDALPALVAAHRRGWPLVVTEHVNFLGELLRSRRARRQAEAVLRRAEAVLPVSAVLEDQLRALVPGANLRRVANPIDLDRFRPADAPSRSFALAVAVQLGEAKGTDVLLRAWARAEGPLPPLVIVGDGPERPRLEHLARELGVEADFRGVLPRDEVAPLLADAAFLVSASRDENVAGIVTEAIASGTPVVSTRVGEPASYVTAEVGLLADPGDEGSLAGAISEMARRHGTYDPSVLHARMAGLYGAEVVRGQLLDVYRDALARRR